MAYDLTGAIAGGSDPGSIFSSASSGFTGGVKARQPQQQQQQPGGPLPRDANGNIDYQRAAAMLLQPYSAGGSAYGAVPFNVPGMGYRPMFPAATSPAAPAAPAAGSSYWNTQSMGPYPTRISAGDTLPRFTATGYLPQENY